MSIILKSGTSGNLADVDATPKALRVIVYDSAGNPTGGSTVVQGNANATAAQAWTVRLSDGAAFYNTLAAGQLPSALVGGRLDTNVGAWLGSTAPTVGQKTSAGSLPVVLASDQSAVTVTGTVTAANPSVGTNAAAAPGSSTQVGGFDGTNLQAARTHDLDTGGGTEFNLGVSVRLPGAGGSVVGGAAGSPFRIDPTGTTTQPVSAASLPLPTGAATEVTLASVLTTAAFQTRINTLGQKTMANSTPVVLASDQSAIPVAQSGAWSVTANLGTTAGLALDATLTGGTAVAIVRGGAKGATTAADVTSTAEGADHQALDVQVYHGGVAVNPTVIRALTASDVVTAAQGTGAGAGAPWSVRLSDGAAFYVGPSTGQLPTALVGGRLDTNVGAWLGSTAPTVGQKTSANSLPVVLASDQSVVPVADNGGSLTVDTPQLPAALVSGRLDVNVGAALPAGTNRIGSVELSPAATPKLTSASVSAAASGDNTLVAGVGGQVVRVYRIMLVVAGAVSITFRDGTGGTNLTGAMSMLASGAIVLDFDSEPWFLTSTGNAFVLNLSSAVQVSGRVYYTQS